MKSELTRKSILKAINDGATSVSAIAIAHGYGKPVSGGVTKKIRSIVPEVADLLSTKALAPAKASAEKTAKVIKAVAPAVAPVAVAPVTKVEKAVKAVKAESAGVVQRKKPYGGKVYGKVFAEAVEAGEVEFRPFVTVIAQKLQMTESQVSVALNVMRNARHQSNGERSQNISTKRCYIHIVPFKSEAVETETVATPEVVETHVPVEAKRESKTDHVA